MKVDTLFGVDCIVNELHVFDRNACARKILTTMLALIMVPLSCAISDYVATSVKMPIGDMECR